MGGIGGVEYEYEYDHEGGRLRRMFESGGAGLAV